MSDLIVLQRQILTPRSTIGTLDVDGTKIYILEDTKREHKVYGETRIPAGTYRLDLRTEGGYHARFAARYPWHRGMIWLRHVPLFEFIYIHPGNTSSDTLGCLLTGLQKSEDRVISSVAAYQRIYPLIVEKIESAAGCHIDVRDEEYESVDA